MLGTEHKLSQTNGMSWFVLKPNTYVRTYVSNSKKRIAQREDVLFAIRMTVDKIGVGGGGLGPEKKRITDRVLKNNRFSNCSGPMQASYSCNYFSISSSRSRNDKHNGLPFETWLCAAGHRRTAHMIQHNGCHTHPAIRYSTFA